MPTNYIICLCQKKKSRVEKKGINEEGWKKKGAGERESEGEVRGSRWKDWVK